MGELAIGKRATSEMRKASILRSADRNSESLGAPMGEGGALVMPYDGGVADLFGSNRSD